MSYQIMCDSAADLFESASPECWAMAVPWTPKWAARDVLAHLVDVGQRAGQGYLQPPTDDEAHAAVLRRRDVAVADLAAELRLVGRRVYVQAGGPSVLWDMVVHVSDVREVWACDPLSEELWMPVLGHAMTFVQGIADHTPSVETPQRVWLAGQPRLRIASDYELFRALFGRRARPEDWERTIVEGDPDTLAQLAFF